jgi:hypothetical protein
MPFWVSTAVAWNGSTLKPAVPVLYLDPGFLATLADRALRFVQIARQFEASGRPTPAASKPLTICVS